MTLGDTHTVNFVISTTAYVVDMNHRPASITISFKSFPHKNNTLVIMYVLAMSSGRKWLSFMSSCDVT